MLCNNRLVTKLKIVIKFVPKQVIVIAGLTRNLMCMVMTGEIPRQARNDKEGRFNTSLLRVKPAMTKIQLKKYKRSFPC